MNETDSESCSKASDVEDEFGEEEADLQQQQQQQRSSAEARRLQQVAEDYQPGDRLKEGTQIFIPLSAQQKV